MLPAGVTPVTDRTHCCKVLHRKYMEPTAEQIQKFFENKCDPTERETIMRYLSGHPEAMKKYFPEQEWKDADKDTPLPTALQEEMLTAIRANIFPADSKTGRILLFVKRIAAAAAVLIIATGITLFFYDTIQQHTVADQVAVANRPAAGRDTLWIEQLNNTRNTMALVLPDGSNVRLEPHSRLKYPSGFGAGNRDIYLEGAAFFDVAKQTGKPFTVYTEILRTIALGTSFRISTLGGDIAIKLCTGKVVVRQSAGLQGWNDGIYLSPGDQVSYNRHKMLATVTRHTRNPATAPALEIQDLIFTNTALKEVMDKLSSRYQHRIIYSKKDITGMNFTGTVTQTDSLDVILRLITTMNHLELKENGTSYIISKSR